jgi:uncharacterized protein (UPF0548 family)
MFSVHAPTQAAIELGLKRARLHPLSYTAQLNTQNGRDTAEVPAGYVLDHTRSQIGNGSRAFEAAKTAFHFWLHFALGWIHVVNMGVSIAVGEIVAVEAHTFGLWSVNFSKIIYLIDTSSSFGFGYGTTAAHVERGEERFLIEYDPASGAVTYDLLAVSQPASLLAQLAYPFTRSQQRRFARDSHQRMKQAVLDLTQTEEYIDAEGILQPGKRPIGLFKGQLGAGPEFIEPLSESELALWEGPLTSDGSGDEQ